MSNNEDSVRDNQATASTDEVVIGIDLGTTNSTAAIATPKGVHVLRHRDGEALIPSVVSYRSGGTTVVGSAAKAGALDHPERTVHSVKRLIGRGGSDVEKEATTLPYPVELGERDLARIKIDGVDRSPEEVSAAVLTEVKRVATEALGRDVDAAVITVPAYFDDAQRQATKHAAALAGLDCRRIINEPTAASLAYGIDGSRDGTVLVYDLGGGTFDVSILRIHEGVFRVLATSGDTHLGGDDFDQRIVERIHELILAHSASGLDALDARAQQAIRSAAEQLKCTLSSGEHAELSIDVAGSSLSLAISRSEFEERIAPLVQRTIDCCRRAMADAELQLSDIDDVVLVGGSTRVPLVRQQLRTFLDKEPRTDVDPDLAVALGAALQARVLSGANRDLLLLDVIPLSLGLETMGGVVSKLILRNATIPASVTEEFSTQVDNQTAVDINVYQGEREKTEDCRHLGSFKLRGVPPMPAGLPRVAVTFTVDADGLLRVTAKETRTGTEASIQVVPSFGLTDGEVKAMMDASLEHAMEDMAAREGVELRNKATAMAEGALKALELADLPPDQTYSIRRSAKSLRKMVAEPEPDIDAMRAKVDELSQLTGQIADDVISSAVKRALAGEDS